MKNHVFIQAHLASKRLPGKVLKKICGKSIVELIAERAYNIKNIDEIILVTGSIEKNKSLVDEVKKIKLSYYCGNEENVLDRFYQASKEFNSDRIIRITGDCPLIDFNIINIGMSIFNRNTYDILSNNRIRTYPLGLNFEIFSKNALQKSWKEVLKDYENEEIFQKTL